MKQTDELREYVAARYEHLAATSSDRGAREVLLERAREIRAGVIDVSERDLPIPNGYRIH